LPQIREPLFWNDDDNNADHIWDRHKVSVDEVKEVIFEDADMPTYVAFWKGPYYVVLGATAGGDYLKSLANS
jgi:hypothetical protein